MDQSTLQALVVLAENYSENPRVVGLDLCVGMMVVVVVLLFINDHPHTAIITYTTTTTTNITTSFDKNRVTKYEFQLYLMTEKDRY